MILKTYNIYKVNIAVFTFFLTVFPFVNKAIAAQSLTFTPLNDQRVLHQLLNLNGINEQNSTFEVAHTDLNEDGIEEIVLKDTTNNCAVTKSSCNYHILAKKSIGEFILLGKIEAKKLLIGQEYTHGVRNILIYDNDENDYKYKIYAWNALKAQYNEVDNR